MASRQIILSWLIGTGVGLVFATLVIMGDKFLFNDQSKPSKPEHNFYNFAQCFEGPILMYSGPVNKIEEGIVLTTIYTAGGNTKVICRGSVNLIHVPKLPNMTDPLRKPPQL